MAFVSPRGRGGNGKGCRREGAAETFGARLAPLTRKDEMKKATRMAVSLTAALLGAVRASATDIADGGAYTITSSAASLVCKGDATLVVKPDTTTTFTDGTQCYLVQTSVIATNGTVTLDFSQRTDLPVLFTKLFRADKNGKVVFKGAGKMLVGTESIPEEPYAIFQAAQTLPFGVAEAEVQGGFQGLEFVNRALLALPIPDAVPWTVRDGTAFLTMAGDTFAGSYAGPDKANLTGAAVTIANFDVCMMSTNVFRGDATITVNAHRTLHVKSMGLKDDWGLTSGLASGWTYTQDIVLADETSRFFPRCAGGMKLAGAVSGTGYIESYEDNGTSITFNGPLSFAGPIKLSGTMYANATTASKANLSFSPGSVAWTEPKDVVINFGTLEFVEAMTGTVKLGTVTGLELANSVLIPRNASLTLEIDKVEGRFSMPAYAAGTLDIADAANGALVKATGVCKVTVNSQVPVAKMAVDENGVVSTYYGFDGASVAHSAELEVVSASVPAGMTLNLPTGATKVELQDGSVNFGRDCVREGLAYVEARASLWLDPSATTSVIALTNAAGEIQDSPSSSDKGPFWPMEWLDQSLRQQWFVANYRAYGNNDKMVAGNAYAGVTSTNPYYLPNALNGLPVFDFTGDHGAAATRMMIFKDKYEKFGDNGFTPAFCIMVYGSKGGGGSALLANPSAAFKRYEGDVAASGLDLPLVNRSDVKAWVNGKSVDPLGRNLLSGGWDVVSLTTLSLQVTGLGFAKSNTGDSKGTSQYAEVIFFHEVPSDDMRQAIELYLADKWGLTDKVLKPQETMTVSGKGALAIVDGSDVKLCGSLVDSRISAADGARVAFENTAAPATQADVAAIKDCVAWFDPSDPTMLTMSTGKDSDGKVKELEVSAVANRIAGAKAPLLVGNNANFTSSRCPWLNREKRAYRSGMNWLDYSIRYEGDVNGDYMFFANKIASHGDASREETAGRMAFIVSDSVRGGGTPIIDGTDPGGSGKIKLRFEPKHTDPIWKSGTGGEVTGGKTYLNGAEVDGSSTGFTGGPEVFAFSTTSDIDFCYQGYWNNSEKKSYGEILGESLYFSRVLSESERDTVTSYLMWKWLGMMPSGRSNFTETTLSGAGTITGVPLAALPQLSDDFTGTVELTESTLDFGVSTPDRPVEGALVAKGATLAMTGEVTLNVALENGRLKTGSYTLIDVAAFSGATGWNLNLVGVSDPNGRAKLVVEGGKVILQIAKGGFIAIVK